MRVLVAKESLFIFAVSLLAGMGLTFVLAQGFWSATRMVRLQNYTADLLRHVEAVSSDLAEALNDAQKHDSALCSQADLDKLKGIHFLHSYVKDAGRIQNGAILCSAVRGKLSSPHHLSGYQYVTNDGFTLATSTYPHPNGTTTITIVQKNHSFVTTSNRIFAAFDQSADGLSAEIISQREDYRLLRIGTLYQGGDNLLRRDYTRCSSEFAFCVHSQIGSNMFAEGLWPPLLLVAAIGWLVGTVLYFFINAKFRKSLSLKTRLSGAIESGAIYLMYQPIVHAASGELAGIEALSRWTDPYLGEVRPDIFISVANHIGKRDELNFHIIRRALKEAAPLLKENPSIYLSINLDVCSFCDGATVDFINDLTAQHQLNPRQIAIEILENSTSEIKHMQSAIGNLRAAGYQVFLDDFGVGYSGLAYLGKLDVDKIKIDKMFSQAAAEDSPASKILSMVTSMAEDIHVGTIFEGVETHSQLRALLRANPGALVQGWIYSKAVAIEKIRRSYPLDTQADLPSAPSAPSAPLGSAATGSGRYPAAPMTVQPVNPHHGGVQANPNSAAGLLTRI